MIENPMLIPLEGELLAAFQELDRKEVEARDKRNGMVSAVLAMKGLLSQIDASVHIEVRPDGIHLTPNGK